MIGVQWALVDSGLAAILFKLTSSHFHSPPPGEQTDQEVAPDTSLPTNHTADPNTARSPARPLVVLQPATEDGQILAHVSKVMAEASSWYYVFKEGNQCQAALGIYMETILHDVGFVLTGKYNSSGRCTVPSIIYFNSWSAII